MYKKIILFLDIFVFIMLLWIPIWLMGYLLKNLTDPAFYRAGGVPVSAFLGIIAVVFMLLEGICFFIYVVIGKVKKKWGKHTAAYFCKKWIREHFKISIMIVLAVLWIAFLTGIFLLQNHILYHPTRSMAAENYLEHKKVCHKIELKGALGERYTGWLHRTKKESCATIVYFGGNAESSAVTMMQYEKKQMWKMFGNYNFLMIDYPGYGQSDGEPGKDSILRMTESVMQYVQKEERLNEKIIVMGFSLGTGAASYAASFCKIDGLVLLAPYDAMRNVYNAKLNLFHGPMKLLARNNFESSEYVQKVHTDALIVASKTDSVIPFRLSENLVDSFQAEVDFCVVDEIEHSALLSCEEVRERIEAYLSKR